MRAMAFGFAFLVTVSSVVAQTEVRYWLAYGSEEFASFARSNGDPQAVVGREIPAGSLKVPSSVFGGGVFKVQLWEELTQSPTEYRYTSGGRMNIAFDRTFCDDANVDPPLGIQSYRKVEPKYQSSLSECVSNGAIVDAYDPDPLDLNGDGVQDKAQLRPFAVQGVFTQGTAGQGESVRPVGLAAYVGGTIVDPVEYAGALSGMRLYRGVPQRVLDIEWRSNLAVGETYGFNEGETGLWIWTRNPSTGIANNTAIWNDAVHIGARYNLIGAVPEPSSLMVLGVGMLFMRRRQHRD
jgi:PEP-CTERM motif